LLFAGRERVSFTAAQLTVTLILLPTSKASVRRQALPMLLSRLRPPCRNAASKAEQDKFNIVEAEYDEAIQGYVPEESIARSQQTLDYSERLLDEADS
jgi:hypothetical protein